MRRGAEASTRVDVLAVEEPLEIRVNGVRLAVTMRTPGNDVELAAGFLVSEGVISRAGDVAVARYCDGVDDTGTNTYNVLDVALAPHIAPPNPELARNFTVTSACGVCGKSSIDTVVTRSAFDPAADDLRIGADDVLDLPERLRDGQAVFDKTGGLHAAALFDADSGDLLVLREDVGRHNAVDKSIGWALLAGRLPLRHGILQVSGRASFELVQKAAMAGVPMLAAVSAPSSLAADLADERGITLVGFSRGESMVIYSHAGRIT